MDLLNLVKQSLMIPQGDSYADLEVNLLISSCQELLQSMGVPLETIYSESKLVEALILIYCKTFYGFSKDGGVKELPKTFNIFLSQIALSSGR